MKKPTQVYCKTNTLYSILTLIRVCTIRVRSFLIGKTPMVFAQIERLKKDSNELDIYAKKLEKKGHTQRAQKIKRKRDFVLRALSEVTGTPQTS